MFGLYIRDFNFWMPPTAYIRAVIQFNEGYDRLARTDGLHCKKVKRVIYKKTSRSLNEIQRHELKVWMLFDLLIARPLTGQLVAIADDAEMKSIVASLLRELDDDQEIQAP